MQSKVFTSLSNHTCVHVALIWCLKLCNFAFFYDIGFIFHIDNLFDIFKFQYSPKQMFWTLKMLNACEVSMYWVEVLQEHLGSMRLSSEIKNSLFGIEPWIPVGFCFGEVNPRGHSWKMPTPLSQQFPNKTLKPVLRAWGLQHNVSPFQTAHAWSCSAKRLNSSSNLCKSPCLAKIGKFCLDPTKACDRNRHLIKILLTQFLKPPAHGKVKN